MIQTIPTIDSTKIIRVSSIDVPHSSMRLFEGLARRFTHPSRYRGPNFDTFLRVEYDGPVSFVVKHNKIYDTGTEEVLVYLTQVDENDDIIGRADMRFRPETTNPFFLNKPFQQYTETYDNYLRRGLGVQRACVHNILSNEFWDLPYHSSTAFCHDADEVQPSKLLWEKLVELGLVNKYVEGTHDRYQFIN